MKVDNHKAHGKEIAVDPVTDSSILAWEDVGRSLGTFIKGTLSESTVGGGSMFCFDFGEGDCKSMTASPNHLVPNLMFDFNFTTGFVSLPNIPHIVLG